MTNSASSIWSMLFHSGPVVQFVLITLLVFSVICWTIIVVKIRRFRQASSANIDFEERFWDGGSLQRVYRTALRMPEAPMAAVFLHGYQELRQLIDECGSSPGERAINAWLQIIERGLDKGIKEELSLLERTIPFLATIGNAAPFIGLFGTVWGIMGSFHNIGLKGSASLATVAPGISEALVATAAGLAAAIPAVMAFNSFMSSLSNMEGVLKGFAADFLNTVERQLVSNSTQRASGAGADKAEVEFAIRGEIPEDEPEMPSGPEVF